MDDRQEIMKKIHVLEQEKIGLDVFGTGSEAEIKRSKEILSEMQPLYKSLGGVYITKINLNYIPE